MKLITTAQYLTILKTKKEVESHLNNNNDFLIQDISCDWDNKPCNKEELLKKNYTHIKIYYGKNNANKVTVLEL